MKMISIKDKEWRSLENKILKDPYNETFRANLKLHVSNLTPNDSYFLRDIFLTDYEPVSFPVLNSTEKDLFFRGPISRAGKKYILLLGAGDGFGAMVKNPFSHLIENYLNIKIVNLSKGGTSLAYWKKAFNNLLEIANSAELLFFTVTSLRSIYFPSTGYTGTQRVFRNGKETDINLEITKLMKTNVKACHKLIREINEKSFVLHQEFLTKIKVPKYLVLLPNKQNGIPNDVSKLNVQNSRGYPHFVTMEYILKLSKLFNFTIIPEKIYGVSYAIDRFSNEAVNWHNGKFVSSYYASQETHLDAFLKTIKII